MIIPMAAVLRYHADRKPKNAVALTVGEKSATWSELEFRANQRARRFLALGVKPGDAIAIAVENCLEYFEVTFAIYKVGAMPCALSHNLPWREASEIFNLLKPALKVVSHDNWPIENITVNIFEDVSAFDGGLFEEAEPTPYWRAITSGGSSGRPKIIVEHKPALFDTSTERSPYLGQAPDETTLIPGPMHHALGYTLSHLGLMFGNHTIVMERFDAEECLRLVDKYKVNTLPLVPTMMHRIWALGDDVRGKYQVSSLHTVFHGGAPTPEWLKRNWIEWLGGETILEVYSATEAARQTYIRGNEWMEHPGSVGKVGLESEHVRICNDDGTDCQASEVGEIYFRNLDPEKIHYHYIGAESKKVGKEWESVGDLGYIDEEGYLYIADRRIDLIIRGGANVYPAEIEAEILAFPGVESAVVVGLPHPDLGQIPHAIFHPEEGQTIDLKGLDDFLSNRLARYKMPYSYENLPQTLRNDAGKVRRSALRAEREALISANQKVGIKLEAER